MPSEVPTAAQLWEGHISFFSIDTDLIQAAGYNFDAGALNQIPKQLPATMELQLTEIVANEIVRHRMEPVLETIQQFRGASDRLKRSAGIPMEGIDREFAGLSVEQAASNTFRKKVEDYAQRCRGGVLPISAGDLAKNLFLRYFSGAAPFGSRKEKKFEFPDAASLLLLEDFARTNGTKGIVASGDEGWSAYVAKSEFLYCVKSIDELTALFAATDEHGKEIKNRLIAAIEDEGSVLQVEIEHALEGHVSSASWLVGDVYSGSVSRVEAEAYDATLTGYTLNREMTKVWATEGDPTSWVVELSAVVTSDVDILLTYYVWDSIDKEEIELTSEQIENESEVEVQIFLTCSSVQGSVAPDDWEVEVEIASGNYRIDLGEVNPDFAGDY